MRKLLCLLCTLCTGILCAASAAAEYHTVLLVNRAQKTITDVDPVSGKVMNSAQLEGVPTSVVFSWDEQWLFVSEPDQGYVAVISARTLKESSRLTRPEFKRAANSSFPLALAVTPDYKKLYVAVPGGLDVFDQRVLVYAPTFHQPDKKIALADEDGQRLLAHGPSSKLYYALGKANQVAVVDTNTDKVLKTIAVKGGPMDVAFMIGGEAWVASADGSVSIIDINKDEVVKTIETGGKGAVQIDIAPDVRFLAVSHDESGDVSILQPITKAVAGTVKIGKGPLSVAFEPAGRAYAELQRVAGADDLTRRTYPPTSQLYVAGPSGVAMVDLEKMAATDKKITDKVGSTALIHYTYINGFWPPRESTSVRIMENDTYTLFDNAMFSYDDSHVHEHRTDMVAVIVGEGVAKIGCWYPTTPMKDQDAVMACPEESVPNGAATNGLPYNYSHANVGGYTGVPRGTTHIEEGASASPRRMVIFMPKNNYYRQASPKAKSDFQGKPEFRQLANPTRAWVWNVMLTPGHPVHLPKTDYAIVYLAGGLMKEVHDGVPTVFQKLFASWDTDSGEKTIEALSNKVPIVVIEFK